MLLDAGVATKRAERLPLGAPHRKERRRDDQQRQCDRERVAKTDVRRYAFAAGNAAALVDGDVFRTMIRRNYFLDPLSVLDDDVAMQERIERIFAGLRSTPRPRSGPSRDELIDVMRTAPA
jgi:hypothetical protein